jgi:hypothetical protein
MTEIEILPLSHDAQTTGYVELIEHIKTLPKNSTVMLEGTHQSLMLIRNVIEHTSGGKVSEEHLRGKAKEMFKIVKESGAQLHQIGPTFIALAEIIHECDGRGIRILPLEPEITHLPSRKTIRGESAPVYSKTYAEYNEKREDRMVQQIRTATYTVKQNTIPCIVGYGHAVRLREKLADAKIPSRVNVSFFRKTRMAESIELSRLVRKKALAGKELEAKRYLDRDMELAFHRIENTLARANRIVTRTQARRVTREFKQKRRK